MQHDWWLSMWQQRQTLRQRASDVRIVGQLRLLRQRDNLLRDERGAGMLSDEPNLQQEHQHLHRLERFVLRERLGSV
jgi:hypothetical protein